MKNLKKNMLTKIRILKRSIDLVLEYDNKYLVSLLILNSILGIMPYLTMYILQKLLNMIGFLTSNSLNQVIKMLVIYGFLTLLLSCIKSLADYLNAKYGEYLYMNLNISFTKKCKCMNAKDYENPDMYDALSRAEQQIGVRPISIIKQFIELYRCVISFVVGLIVIAKWNIKIVVLFLILPFVTFKYFERINKEEYNIVKMRTNDERRSWYISYLLFKDYNIKEIKTFGLYDYFFNQFSEIKNKLYKQNIYLYKKKVLLALLNSFLNVSITLLVYISTIVEAIMGQLPVGTVVLYISSTKRIEEMINTAVRIIFNLSTDLMYADFIFKFYDLLNTNVSESGPTVIENIEKIEFKNVSYKYGHEKFALKNINYEFLTGHNYAIVGKNGSGKSTLIKLLSGLYDDYSGEILIDGIELKNINKDSYKNAISVQFQDFNKYEMSAKDNIRIGNVNKTRCTDPHDYLSIAKMTGVDAIVENLPEKYDQQLGSWFKNGVQLSGGQWQKIAMARCMYRKASVYLYDEATSALDLLSEQEFYNHLNMFKNNRINICVTHRIKNIQNIDKVLVLENGELKKEGDYDGLMKGIFEV